MDTLEQLPEIISRVIELYNYDLRHRNKPANKRRLNKLHAKAVLAVIRECTDRIEAIVDYEDGFQYSYIPHLVDAMDSLVNVITLSEERKRRLQIEGIFDKALDGEDLQEFEEE